MLMHEIDLKTKSIDCLKDIRLYRAILRSAEHQRWVMDEQ